VPVQLLPLVLGELPGSLGYLITELVFWRGPSQCCCKDALSKNLHPDFMFSLSQLDRKEASASDFQIHGAGFCSTGI